MGENHLTSAPSALYGFVLLMAGVAYWVLQQLIIAAQGAHSVLKTAIGSDWKGKSSPFLYLLAIVCSLWSPVTAHAIYALVALPWLIPDRRIERTLTSRAPE